MSKNPIDVLRMALEREKDAVRYYKEYATAATDPAIREMFEFLVEEEVKHVKLLEAEVEKEIYHEN